MLILGLFSAYKGVTSAYIGVYTQIPPGVRHIPPHVYRSIPVYTQVHKAFYSFLKLSFPFLDVFISFYTFLELSLDFSLALFLALMLFP